MTAVVPANLIANAGTASVTVVNPGPPQVISNSVTFSITEGGPFITALSPASAQAGGPQFTLTITGGGFVATSGVRWNGSALTTTFFSSTQLTAVVPAGLISNPGTASITVVNPGSPQVTSPAFVFSITQPTGLTITSLSPSSVAAGSPQFTLTVRGTGFGSNSGVRWNGSTLQTTFVSSTELSAVVPAGLVQNQGTATITVVNTGPTQVTSGSLTFTITAPQTLRITSISPTQVTAGGPQFTLTVNGAGFLSSSRVNWNQTALTTTFVSAAQMTAVVPAGMIQAQGMASITAVNPGPPQVSSNALNISIVPLPPPTLTLSGGSTANPTDTKGLQVTLSAVTPLALTGTIQLQFSSNAVNSVASDPDVKFVGGGLSANFTIPAGQMQAPVLSIQTGTVAGTISARLTAMALGGNSISPLPQVASNIQVARSIPRITNVTLVQRTGGFDVCVSGYSNTRDITASNFTFGSSGSGILQTTQLNLVSDVVNAFSTWYRGASSPQYGGKFLYTQSFTISGPTNAIGSVSVALQNAVGISTVESHQFSGFAASCN